MRGPFIEVSRAEVYRVEYIYILSDLLPTCIRFLDVFLPLIRYNAFESLLIRYLFSIAINYGAGDQGLTVFTHNHSFTDFLDAYYIPYFMFHSISQHRKDTSQAIAITDSPLTKPHCRFTCVHHKVLYPSTPTFR